jgi:F-type H+-transporting ATPase subunit a
MKRPRPGAAAMGLEFLARVRSSTLWLAAVVALLLATYAGWRAGAGFAAGAAWSLANLWALERLIVTITGSERRTAVAARRAGLVLAGMLALFGAGALLLMGLPPAALVAGFLAPFAVMVFKAAAALLLDSPLWARLTRDPWRALALVVAVAALAWAVAASLSAPGGASPAPARQAQTVAPGGGYDAEHATEPGGAASTGPEKFANVVSVLVRAFPGAGWAHWLHRFEPVLFSLLVALILSVVAFFATRDGRLIPGPLQNGVECAVETLYDFVVGILGPKFGPRYVPYLGTLFVYILAMNLFGLIPFMDSPTSSLNVTVGLALCTFLYVQWTGIRELGVLGYVDHMAGRPRSAISWFMVPIMLPVHLIGELAKPVSLSCRLFGNVFGEDMLLVAFTSLGVATLSFVHSPVGIPWQFPFLLLALLTSTIQALVFTVLSTIYLLLMLPHEEHGHEEASQPAH